MKILFNKRSLLGTLLLLLMVGEASVPQYNGLYTPAGFIGLFLLYFVLFHVFESFCFHYKFTIAQLFLFNFVVYSVIVTGFLHKEITEYVVQKDYLFTTLIRIQCSMYVFWAFILLNRLVPRNTERILSVRKALLLATGFVFLLSFTPVFGLKMIFVTLKLAPGYAMIYLLLAGIAIVLIRRGQVSDTLFHPTRSIKIFLGLFLVLGLIPNIWSFVVLVIAMILGSLFYLRKKEFRNSTLWIANIDKEMVT